MTKNITSKQYTLIKKIIEYFGIKGLITDKELEYKVKDEDIDLILYIFNNENNLEILDKNEYTYLNIISSQIIIKEKLKSVLISQYFAKYLFEFAKKEINLNIKLNTDFICFSENDPVSKNINYNVSIYSLENDNNLDGPDSIDKIGEMELSTSNVNLLNINEFDIEVLDSISSFESKSNLSIIDIDNYCINEKVLPKEIFENVIFNESLFLLNIKNFVLHKDYRGLNLTNEIFNILKVIFPNHIFILKPFPLQHSSTIDDKNINEIYSLPKNENLKEGIQKLIKVYSNIGFKILKVKSTEPYMVMLNSI